MKLINFLVGSFLIGIGLIIRLQLQSAITQIFKSFFNIKLLIHYDFSIYAAL